MWISDRTRHALLAVLLVGAPSGCGAGSDCFRYSDCDPGLTCAYGSCVLPPQQDGATGDDGESAVFDFDSGTTVTEDSGTGFVVSDDSGSGFVVTGDSGFAASGSASDADTDAPAE
ncbi:MAG: hypothetical protein WBY94_22325 [Polyangiaceae bacterium]